MIGKKFERWTVLEKSEKRGTNRYYLCKCDCGVKRKVRESSLKRGRTKSCGCLSIEKTGERSATHGMSGTRFYIIWAQIKDRCQNENHAFFRDYGGRGIKVCDRWQTFENFRDDTYKDYLKHVEEHGEDNTTIDRIDNDGNYEPSNFRWATRLQQNLNQRRQKNNTSGHVGVSWRKTLGKWSAYITVNGKRKTLGVFTDLDLAIEARKAAEEKYWNKDIIS